MNEIEKEIRETLERICLNAFHKEYKNAIEVQVAVSATTQELLTLIHKCEVQERILPNYVGKKDI